MRDHASYARTCSTRPMTVGFRKRIPSDVIGFWRIQADAVRPDLQRWDICTDGLQRHGCFAWLPGSVTDRRLGLEAQRCTECGAATEGIGCAEELLTPLCFIAAVRSRAPVRSAHVATRRQRGNQSSGALSSSPNTSNTAHQAGGRGQCWSPGVLSAQMRVRLVRAFSRNVTGRRALPASYTSQEEARAASEACMLSVTHSQKHNR